MTLSPIYTTNENNDQDLVKALGSLSTPMELACGDVNFLGYWLDNERVWIWGERKKLSDLVNCVMDSGRLLRQIQDAHQAGFKHKFLIVEAMYRRGPTNGLLEYRSGKEWKTYHLNPRDPKSATVPYSRVSTYLDELRYYLNVHIYRTNGVRETADVIRDIYALFQQPPDQHNSLKQFATSPEPISAFLSKPSLLRRMAKELPHIGWDRSKDIEEELGTARELCRVLAGLGEGETREKLLGIEGIGKKTVEDIEKALDE